MKLKITGTLSAWSVPEVPPLFVKESDWLAFNKWKLANSIVVAYAVEPASTKVKSAVAQRSIAAIGC